MLVHGPGDIQGEYITLDDEFRAFIYRCYEIYPKGHPQAGRRVYRRAVLSRPKGRAKSELAGMIACAEALGNVRFAGWDAYGDPVGAPITGAVVRCFATEESQAGNTYANAQYMLANGYAFDAYEGIDVGLTRTFLPEGGEIVAQTSSAKSKDGGKDTFDVFDETHLWVGPQLTKLHDTVTRNLMKRKLSDGWSLETSTMYAPGEDSVAEETHKTARKIANVYFDHKQAPLDTDITNDDELTKALCYVYGPAAEWMDITGLLDEFHNPQNRESDLRRYWLNQPWTTEEKFTTPNAWDALLSNRTIEAGAKVVLALDGSYNNDSTAVVLATVEDVPHLTVIGAWERTTDTPSDWTVDVLDVEEAIRQARLTYNVLELTADPFRWTRTLQVMEDEGCATTTFPQNQFRMTPATSNFSDLIASRGITHDGNEPLRRHVLNAIFRNDNRGKRLSKEKKDSPLKIDLAVAALMALSRACDLVNDPKSQPAHVFFGQPIAPQETRPGEYFWLNPQPEQTVLRTVPGREFGEQH